MKRALPLIILLAIMILTACFPSAPTLVPAETAAALTMQAKPKTPTLRPAPSDTPVPTSMPTAEPSATPDVPPGMPGARCIPQNTERLKGVVTGVLDGETIEVAIGNDIYRVRYIGVDAPGVAPMEWMGSQAVAANSTIAGGQFVILVKDTSDINQDGALMRYVFTDNAFVNYELIRQGYTRTKSLEPDLACESAFQAAQTNAMANEAGIWKPTPIPTATMTLTPTITPTPTETQYVPCNCNQKNMNCNRFSTQAEAQACFDYCIARGNSNVLRLDKNGNGRACEGMN